jgi:hypothetical protein
MKKIPTSTVGTLVIAGCAVGSPSYGASDTTETANIVELVCENPRREYLITYKGGPFASVYATAEDGDTHYKVLAVEETKDRHVVTGLTLNDGPTYRLHLRPYKKIEYFVDNQLVQTDGCR